MKILKPVLMTTLMEIKLNKFKMKLFPLIVTVTLIPISIVTEMSSTATNYLWIKFKRLAPSAGHLVHWKTQRTSGYIWPPAPDVFYFISWKQNYYTLLICWIDCFSLEIVSTLLCSVLFCTFSIAFEENWTCSEVLGHSWIAQIVCSFTKWWI